MRRFLVIAPVLGSALVLCACSSFQAGATEGEATPTAATAPLLAAVSRSDPGPDAAAALDSCGITNFVPGHPGQNLDLGIDVVTGMALITPGRDANQYAAIGNAPEIKTDKSAWVITTSGWLTLGVFAAGPAENPTCVVIDGDLDDPLWYITGNQMVGENIDQLVTPGPQPSPVFKLPPLAP
jgi:hypothetical protein